MLTEPHRVDDDRGVVAITVVDVPLPTALVHGRRSRDLLEGLGLGSRSCQRFVWRSEGPFEPGTESLWVDHFGGGPGRFKTALLACGCGEAGCWDFLAAVTADRDTVRWSDFAQGHRPQWDYREFGPFEFDRVEYEAALRDA
jgi:hypothetical protein